MAGRRVVVIVGARSLGRRAFIVKNPKRELRLTDWFEGTSRWREQGLATARR